jgi:Rho-binding antiterminator
VDVTEPDPSSCRFQSRSRTGALELDGRMRSRRYRPIDCSLHDHLEAAATLGKPLSVTYRAGDGTEVHVEDRIVDIVSSGGVEFVRLEKGRLVRLDDLVMVGSIPSVG